MQILGIGPLEFLFIVVIMILVLGPRGMVKAARESGKFIRKVTRSPLWAEIVGTSREVRNLPTRIIKEAGIQAEIDELRRSTLPELEADPQRFFQPKSGEKPAATNKLMKKKPTRKNGPPGTRRINKIPPRPKKQPRN